jgi:hypothetical protein
MLVVIAQPLRHIEQIEHSHLYSTSPACAIICKPAALKRAVGEFIFLSCTPGNSPESSKQYLAWRSAGVASVVIYDILTFLLAVSSGGPNESKAAGFGQQNQDNRRTPLLLHHYCCPHRRRSHLRSPGG